MNAVPIFTTILLCLPVIPVIIVTSLESYFFKEEDTRLSLLEKLMILIASALYIYSVYGEIMKVGP